MVTTSPQPSPPQAAEREQARGIATKRAFSPVTCHWVDRAWRGFTLIELLVVMAIIALLLAIAVPRYFHSTDRAREAVLKEDLAQMRNAIDKYHGDKGRYPDALEDLVTGKYLRRIPPDPITESSVTWVSLPPQPSEQGRIFDVKSGAPGAALDGTQYGDW
jgi:general secretion pathway protein G